VKAINWEIIGTFESDWKSVYHNQNKHNPRTITKTTINNRLEQKLLILIICFDKFNEEMS
jgi:hypothetical protein